MSQVYDGQRVEVLLSEHAELRQRFERIALEQAEIKQLAEARIRELEAQLDKITFHADRNTLRIAKAREILERCVKHGQQLGPMNMERALEALEGK